MPELFKLEKKEFSQVYQEKQWTYICLFSFTFKRKIIRKITITDHIWRKKEREWITKELILIILTKEINGRERMKPQKVYDNREVFVREYIPHQNRFYRLIFWFKVNETSHLWIRNCYPIDSKQFFKHKEKLP